MGKNADIFFPKNFNADNAIDFTSLAKKFLKRRGFEPLECESEEESRMRASEILTTKKWPVYFFKSDTTGEKDFEEFFTDSEKLDMGKLSSIGIIKNDPQFDEEQLLWFENEISRIRQRSNWQRGDIVNLFYKMILLF